MLVAVINKSNEMKSKHYYALMIAVIMGCTFQNQNNNSNQNKMEKETIGTAQELDTQLPTIGILVFDGFLGTEVMAPLDVFTKPDEDNTPLFNVVLLAKESKVYRSEEGLKVLPDFTLGQSPNLNVLVVPSSYNPEAQQKDKELISFIRKQHKTTEYTASHCAGAFLLAEAGVADGNEIVTYVSGGKSLQDQYPNLIVLNDSTNTVVRDGKIISSNGNMISYYASLELLESLTNKQHRKLVEEQLYFDRLVALQ